MLSQVALDLIDVATQGSGDFGSPGSMVVPIVIGIILGAACGAIAGLIVARLLRFIAYLAGRHFEGNFLILIGALAGAAFFVWMAVTRGGF